jgi:hypothetical protein
MSLLYLYNFVMIKIMLLPSPSIFFFRLPKTRRLKYGMGDRQNRKVETMLYVYLKKLVGNATQGIPYSLHTD